MSTAACPAYSLEYGKVYDDVEIRRFYARFSSVFELIKNNTGLDTGKRSAIDASLFLYDALLVEVILY